MVFDPKIDKRLNPSYSVGSGTIYQVAQPIIPLTSTPNPEAGLASQLLYGENFEVFDIEHKTGLAYGKSQSDGYCGFTPLACLSRETVSKTHFISALSTHVYSEPNMKTRPVSGLPFGARIAVEGIENSFACVEGNYFIPKQHISETFNEKDFVAFAERFLGTPYLWGGRSAAGIDCSGLAQLSLISSGQPNVWRDSDMQEYFLGSDVQDINLVKRGDLVFWRGHVGIMQSDQDIIHANAHHMQVTSEKLHDVIKRIKTNGFGDISSIKRI